MACALFAAYPELGERLPHRPLGPPTPIERVTGLLPPGSQTDLWVKREDLAGTVYGGNKVRKLEFLLGGPQAGGLLTLGGYGSHHVLATALYGRALGLLVDAVVYPQPPTDHARDTVRCSLGAGARLWPSAGYLDVPWQLGRALLSFRGEPPRGRPRLVPPGGSSPRGTLGWVSGGLEVAAQVRAGEAPRFDTVYAALGSGGTAAGLWLGLGEAAAELCAVRVVPAPVASRWLLRRLAGRTAALLAQHLRPGHVLPPRPALRVDGRWLGAGYGHPTPSAEDAVARARDAGLVLETTYTGKTMAALLADAGEGRLRGKRVLFLHSFSSRDLSGLRAADLPADRVPERLRRFLG